MNRRMFLFLLISFGSMCFLCSCNRKSPPDYKDVTQYYEANHESLEAVAQYLRAIDDNYQAYDRYTKPVLYANANGISLEQIQKQLESLWQTGCEDVIKDNTNTDNTISFQLWHRESRQAECGIACTVNGEGQPHVQFQIEVKEIAPGWYYYYANYELFRSKPRMP